MKKRMHTIAALLAAGAITLLTGCSQPPLTSPPAPLPPVTAQPSGGVPASPDTKPTVPPPATQPPAEVPPVRSATPAPGAAEDDPSVTVAAKPLDIAVVVNKQIKLPDHFLPDDLVEPNVPFIFAEHDPKRLMRKEAARALEEMFAGASKDGVHLAGVSGFRSFETQAALFNYYVSTQGEEQARRYSARPGFSEHQTGLAMDVSGSTGKCAADDCFAGTPEAKWLEQHAPEYGFIIRYPKEKEAITGYAYEPWHVRYVGTALSTQIAAKGLTLEEYFGLAHPVSTPTTPPSGSANAPKVP